MRKIERRTKGFTFVEMLVVVGILLILIGLSYPALTDALVAGRAAASTSNLRQLCNANLTYASDNGGFYCPAQEPQNLIRWHGARTSDGSAFDASKGFLSPYLGEDGRVKVCPLFMSIVKGAASFEDGSGGYGYNEIYIGGTPQDAFQATTVSRVPHASRTVMFTTTAFAQGEGLQEYPFSEPPQWVSPNNVLSGSLQPSVHFRDNGRALVGWCDGHVTAELPNDLVGPDYYGGHSSKSQIGWFGPTENNGYWNPAYSGP